MPDPRQFTKLRERLFEEGEIALRIVLYDIYEMFFVF